MLPTIPSSREPLWIIQATIYNSTTLIGLIQSSAVTPAVVLVLLLDRAEKCPGICEGGVKGTVGKREEHFSLTLRSERGQHSEREKQEIN